MSDVTQNFQTEKTQQSSKLLRWPEVASRVGICRSHAHHLAAQGKFPKPIKLSERVSAWVGSDVNIWIEQRISAGKGSANEI